MVLADRWRGVCRQITHTGAWWQATGGDTGGGSLLLDITENRIDGQFLASDGSVPDRFTIVKDVNKTTALTTKQADTLQLKASWPGRPANTVDVPGESTPGESTPGESTPGVNASDDYRWITGQTTRSVRYVADKAGTFSVGVSDGKQCLADAFTITVTAPPVVLPPVVVTPPVVVPPPVVVTPPTVVTPPAVITALDDPLRSRLRIFPNPTHDRVSVDLSAGKRAETSLRLTDLQGRIIYQKDVGSVTSMNESVVLPTVGTFLLQVQVGGTSQTQQVIRQ